MGALVKDARLVAEADAPADEEVPVGVVVKIVVHDPWEAQHHITKEGRVLHHLGESWREDPGEWLVEMALCSLLASSTHPPKDSGKPTNQRREQCLLHTGC